MEIGTEAPWFPAASQAKAEMVWPPLLAWTEFHVTDVDGPGFWISEPTMTPSTRTCNLVTPTLSLLETCMAVSPTTVADWEGDKIETKGGVVSARTLLTVTVTAADVAELPAASDAVAVRVWGPLEAEVVFQDKEAGLNVILITQY